MLEVKWKEVVDFWTCATYLVSILVMLEVKWKGFRLSSKLGLYPCFNPCYVGSKMESLQENIQCKWKRLFQSLLCWK